MHQHAQHARFPLPQLGHKTSRLRRLPIGWLLPTFLALLAGCGGTDPVTAAEVETCLKQKHPFYSTDPDSLDVLAQDAGEGAFVLDLAESEATIVIERTAGDAERTEEAYATFGVDAGLMEREGNALVVYERDPVGSDRENAEGCISP